MGKVPAINFNHIDDDLSEADIRMLARLYLTYHRKCWCYKQLFKSLKRKDLALHLVSPGLVAVGATSSVYVNPIALTATGLGMVLHALAKKKNYPKKVETCRFAYTSYQKELNSLRGYLRGNEFSEPILLFELGRLDDTIADLCPLIPDKLSMKYYKKFDVSLPGPPVPREKIASETDV